MTSQNGMSPPPSLTPAVILIGCNECQLVLGFTHSHSYGVRAVLKLAAMAHVCIEEVMLVSGCCTERLARAHNMSL